jgi:hypothetical protein
MQATAAIIGDLTGRKVATTALAYYGNCISLGQHDGIFQVVDGDAQSTKSLRGRPAAGVKKFVLKGTAWNMFHPTYGLPTRRHRLAKTADRAPKALGPVL